MIISEILHFRWLIVLMNHRSTLKIEYPSKFFQPNVFSVPSTKWSPKCMNLVRNSISVNITQRLHHLVPAKPCLSLKVSGSLVPTALEMGETQSPNDALQDISTQYKIPSPQVFTSFNALKDRIKHHYDFCSEYYYSLWYCVQVWLRVSALN